MAEYKNLTSSEEKILDAMLKNGGLTAAQEAELLEAAIAVEQERLSGAIKNGNFAESLINKIKDSTLLSDDQKSQLLNFAAEAEKEEMELRAQNSQNADMAPTEPQGSDDTSGDNASDDTSADTGSESAADNVVTNDAPANDTPAAPKIKNLERMEPSELLALRKDLNTKTTDKAVAQNIELENHVVGQAKKYNEDKAILTAMEEVYALQELLSSVRENPQGKIAKDNTKILDDAIAKSTEEINNFEEEYGIADNILQTPEVVAKNITDLDNLPSDDALFELDIKPEKLQSPTAYQDVVAILQAVEQSKKIPEIPVLAGALQCKELNTEQKNKLLDYAYQQVGQASKLEQKNFKNFEFLLDALKEYPKPEAKRVIGSKSKMLAKAREQYQQQAPLKHKEFQDVYNVIKSLEVKGPLKTFGRKTIAQTGKDSDIAVFMSQVRNQTEMYLANTQKEIKPEVFRQEYADRLAKGLTEVVYGDRVSKGQVAQKDFEKMFDNLAQAAGKKQTIKVNQDSLIGWQAAKTTRAESAVNKLSQKKGFKEVAKTFGNKLKNLDASLTKKYGALYNIAKGALKSGGWGMAYAAAGATLGPAGIAAVATASFANQAYKFSKDFKKARQEAIKEGKKPDSLFQYMKKNKMKTAGILLSGASAAIGIGGLGDVVAVQVAKSSAGISLAAAGAFKQASDAYNKTKGTKGQKAWAATKAFAISGASFAAGMLAGKSAGEWAGEHLASHSPDASLPNSPLQSNVQQPTNPLENPFEIQGRDNVTIPLRPEDQMTNDVPTPSAENSAQTVQHEAPTAENQTIVRQDMEPLQKNPDINVSAEVQNRTGGIFIDDNSGQEIFLDSQELTNLGEGIRHWENIQEIHYNSETHDLMYKLQDDNGNLISITMNGQGEITALNTGTTEYSQAQLDFVNNNAEKLGFSYYKEQYSGLSAVMEKVGESDVKVGPGQTLDDVLQSPTQETSVENAAKAYEDRLDAMAKARQDQFEAAAQNRENRFNAAAQNREAQFEAAEQNRAAAAQTYENKLDAMAENREAQFNAAAQNREDQFEAAAQNREAQFNAAEQNREAQFNAAAQNREAAAQTQEPVINQGHPQETQNISEDLGRAAANAYIDEMQLSQANADLAMFANENGTYSYGLGESPDMNTAMEMHNAEARNAISAYNSLQDLEAKGDALTPEEITAKADLQATLDGYAERGLTFDDDGKPVFATDLLKAEAVERIHNDYVAEMENGLDLKDVDVQKMNNGDVKIAGEIDGQQVDGRMGEDGNFKNLTINGEKVTGEELKQFNEDMKYKNEALNNIVRDEAKLEAKLNETEAQRNAPLGEKTVQEPQSQEAPAKEAEAPVKDQPAQEAPAKEAEAPAKEQPAQEAPAKEAEAPAQNREATAQTQETVINQGHPQETQNISEDLGRAAANAYIDEMQLSQANADLAMFANENGTYSYGLGESPDMNTAMEMHNAEARNAISAYNSLQDLEAKGDALTPEEITAKADLQATLDGYAERGLTFDDDGKPVFATDLLKAEAVERIHNDYVAEMENGLDLKDVDVQKMNNGDVKIAGEIDGQQVDGRMGEDGNFKNLTINGEKVTGEELKQFNEDMKYKNEALNNIVRDEAKLEAKLNETEAQRNAPLGEKTVQEPQSQEAPAKEAEAPVKDQPAQEAPAKEAEAPVKDQPAQEFASGQVYSTQDRVAWQIGEKGEIEVTQAASRDVQLEASKLTPQVVQQPDGSYKCGYFSSPDPQVAQGMQQHAMEVTLNKESVAAEFRQMQAEGKPLPDGADKFLADHEAGLKTLGLERDDNGNLVRADNKADNHTRSDAEKISELRGTAKHSHSSHSGHETSRVKADNTQGFMPKSNGGRE